MHLKRISLLTHIFPTTEHYPFSLPFLNHTKEIILDTPVTIFSGENGSGKSTLLEAIVEACGIYIWRNSLVSRQSFNKFEKQLNRYIKTDWTNGKVPGAFFGSDSFKDFTHYLEQWASSDPGQLEYFGDRSLITQSHGQSMMAYFKSRYKLKGIYFLDEPETALSPKSQLELLKVIKENSEAGHAQFILVTHSPILLACDNATIFNFNEIPLNRIEYKKTENYQIYKRFLMEN